MCLLWNKRISINIDYLKLSKIMKARLPTILCLLLQVFSPSNADLDTEYYARLINEETTKAMNYQLPTSNEEFRSGYESQNIEDAGDYDWIIVGAGSAGSVLATRLSEIDEWNILLLEAGREEDDFGQIPVMWMHKQFGPSNWGYYSTPQKKCCQGMVNKKCIIPRGKSLGGSSAINGMMYVRGNRFDYDKWVVLGNPGWSYDECLPYFKKSENSQIDGDRNYHGKGGLWNVQYSLPPSPYLSNFLDGTQELNATNLDYNGRRQIGSAQLQYNIKHGRRQSINVAFLDMARRRKNLKVLSGVLVTRILIDPETKIARGVEFVSKDKKYNARATKEVIISAGTINTPQLLMLSGIGPKEHLETLGIKVVVDAPVVGKNLLEHPMFPALAIRTNVTLPNVNILDIIDLYLDGLGPLTKATGAESIFFIHTGPGNREVPTTEAIFVSPTGDDLSIFVRGLNFNETLITDYLEKINTTTDVLLFLSLLHEKSRGEITLQSASPLDFPGIDLNMLDEEEDVDTMADGIEVLLQLMETKPFKQINATLLDFPICQDYPKGSRKFFKCIIRQMTTTIYHPCGTARMGYDRRASVVDKNLKVHGTKRLRVIDASIFPTTISGHINAATVMVAEKSSEQVKREYGRFKIKENLTDVVDTSY